MARFKSFRNSAVALVGIPFLVGGALAAPATYSFSTGAVTSAPFDINTQFNALGGAGATVSGSFVYDSASPFVQDVGTGRAYGGYDPSTGFAASFTSLSGTVSGTGLSFSDARGSVSVGNDRPVPGIGLVDNLQIGADPALNSLSPRNLVGFTVGDYTLKRVRFFWIETQTTPGLIGDFLSNELLPSELPGFNGRLAFDFVKTGTNPTAPDGVLFFDNLRVVPTAPIPEPETYAMMLAGLGLLALARRNKAKAG